MQGAGNIVMPTNRVGDMDVSAIALGCFAFGGDRTTGSHLGGTFAKLHDGLWGEQPEADTFATVKAALDAGVNLLDNAEMYGGGYAEEVTGRALKASGYARDSYYIATKVSESNLAPELVREHCEASIARMDCGYIDLYQLHWHSAAALRTEKYPDRPLAEVVPMEETFTALASLQAEGKIRHVGVCNFGVSDLRRAIATGVQVVSNQISYNLLWRGIEHEVVAFCREHDIQILPWGPMAQGLLCGKFATADDVPPARQRSRLFCGRGPGARPQQRHGEPGCEAQVFAALEKFKCIAASVDASMANIALAWVRQQPGVASTLMGARTPEQLARNLQSLQLELTPKVLGLLSDAGEDVKLTLGANLDPYESEDSTRII